MEIDEVDLSRYGPAALRAKRPDLLRLADLIRRNLRAVESALGIRPGLTTHSDVADDLRAELCAADARIESLEHDLSTARAWIDHLTGKLAAIEDDEEAGLYRGVGLAPCAHSLVIAAARRALLQHHHPDRWPSEQKAAATANFQSASAAFDSIARLRSRC